MDQVDEGNIDPCIPAITFGGCDQDNDGLTNDEEVAGGSSPTDGCDPDPNSLSCSQSAQAGGFYYAWDDYLPDAFGEAMVNFDNTGIREITKAPPIGVHPRVYFGPDDIPDIRDRMLNTASGQEAMAQIHAYTTLLHRGRDCSDSYCFCLLYTSPSPRDLSTSRMPSSA